MGSSRSMAECETKFGDLIETHVIALHSDVGVDVKSDRIELFDSFSLVKREL